MATQTELLKEVLTEAGGDSTNLPDNLISTLLKEIAKTIGGSQGGTSPTISVLEITGGHRITITDVNGTQTIDVMDGSAGQNGAKGADGVGIQAIEQTTTSTADGGNNIFTVTLTNGKTATFTVKNGSKGAAGSAGANGTAGKSAYQYAQDGGYTGTEEEFATMLAQVVAGGAGGTA